MAPAPLSLNELNAKAAHYEWNPSIKLKYWLRAAETIHHEGMVYLRDGDLAQAYIVLQRYSMLVVNNLTKHPEAKDPAYKGALRPIVKRIPAIVNTLELLKPQLDASYNAWQQLQARRRAQIDVERETRRSPPSSRSRHQPVDDTISWRYVSPAQVLDVNDHQDLAVDLAKKEMDRRRRKAGIWDIRSSKGETHGSTGSRSVDDDNDLRRQMEATRRKLDDTQPYGNFDSSDSRSKEGEGQYISSSYSYPSISKSKDFRYEPPAPPLPRREAQQPPRPPKERFNYARARTPSPPRRVKLPPPLPGKEPFPSSETFVNDAPPLPPKRAESPKEKRVTFTPVAKLENGDNLRSVFLPGTLRDTFMDLAQENTRKGLEMCGILCGTPVNNALFITCLLIPEQKCTSDTCETENESAMLDYCITKDLLIIGWIHTHPTQTCFMSSRDLHTQAGYQVMMPESIAIVCSPRFEPSWGIFRLTNPPGLPHILQCDHNDTFHQHSIDRIYTDASYPGGHVFESGAMEFDVHDLRPKH
ncbi:hypothetical protein B0H63DRAFT_494467 [Podospora didyma]|uniref:MPN domain-containing protein n=1 Tax=Podospora didyma TaxID=330526 RepID=A0AAE0NPY1_9PEZI|nr:hypothetical protein B0H63DRAFT_494467 [Podospora didyma]